jgi:hypothetical protein
VEYAESPRHRDEVRASNDRIASGARTHRFEPGLPVPFMCECGDPGCEEFVPLTLVEYDRARNDGIWFTAPMHAVSDAKLVRAAPGYCVFGLW